MTGHVSAEGLVVIIAAVAGILIGLLIRHKAGGAAFWRGVFSDGGYPSFSRVSSAFVLIVACGWVSRSLSTTGDMTQVAALLREVTPFLASTLALTYGINKIGATIGAVKGRNGNGSAAPAPAPGPPAQ